MPAKGKYHDIVVTALEKEGWQITHDPYKLMVGKRKIPKSEIVLAFHSPDRREDIEEYAIY